jgi:HlyD family secretion protein
MLTTKTPLPTRPVAAPTAKPAPAAQKKPASVIAPAVRPPVALPPATPKKPASAVRSVVVAPVRESVPSAPPKAQRSRAKLIVTLLVILILIVSVSVYIGGTKPQSVTVAAAPRRVAAPGLVEAESGLVNLSFELSGKLVSVCVEEGQTVQAGQVIAELQNDDATARVDAAKAVVGVAEAQLKTLEVELAAEVVRCERTVDRCHAELALLKAGPRPEEIARARAEVAALDSDHKRAADDESKYSDKAAMKAGAWTVQQRDNARHLAESAAARLNAARETLAALTAGSRKEDIDRAQAVFAAAEADLKRARDTQDSRLNVARAQVAEAHARLKISQAELGKTVLRTPIAGKVVWKHHHAGESVGVLSPDPVVAIADCARLRIRASVDEADFVNVKPGQKVQITSDSCPGKTFAGTVTQLSNSAGPKKFSTGEAKERQDVNIVETLVRIDEPTPLKLGVRVTAIFETGK